MKNIIVGTAGHIDHGKTALVKALTGIDADRLEEEKRRGITIDIGFAHLQLTPELRLGFVDVPGHERFIKNMLAGVSGIDLVLFVIAADESIKPQTREHFDICRLLGIPQGVVALTKADLVEPDILGLVRLEVEEFVAGSFLEGAPVVAVSSVTGAGLDHLRRELERAACTVPSKSAAGHFRLPLDRAFTVRGFGTVVTGTLISGTVHKEQEVELYPMGRRLRVRGVQVYGKPAYQAVGGERTALNLADIEPAEVARGMVLAAPGTFRTVTQVDCALELLPSAKPLKNRAPVHFHAGTAEIEAHVRLLDCAAALQPGQRCWARIVLREPALLLPGDRFIIRMFSPVVTIGGGIVLDTGGQRYRKGGRVAERLQTLAEAPEAQRIALLVRESNYGMGTAELVARTGLTERQIATAAADAPLVPLSARETAARGARVSSEEPAAPRHPQAGFARPRTAGFAAVPDRRHSRAGETDRGGRRKRAAGQPQAVAETRRGAGPRRHRTRFRAGRLGGARAAGRVGEFRRGGRPRALAVADPAARKAADQGE